MAFEKGNTAGVRFLPGQSGNPAGKPPGAQSLSWHIKNMLNDEDFDLWLEDKRDGFVQYKGAPIKAIVKVALIRAAGGDDKAREWLAKYGYGQKFEIEGNIAVTVRELTDAQIQEKIQGYLARTSTDNT